MGSSQFGEFGAVHGGVVGPLPCAAGAGVVEVHGHVQAGDAIGGRAGGGGEAVVGGGQQPRVVMGAKVSVLAATSGAAWMLGELVGPTDSWPSFIIQGGALALLAGLLFLIFARIVPSLMEQRTKELSAIMEQRKQEHVAFIGEIRDARQEYRAAVANIHSEARMEREASDEQWRLRLKELSDATLAMSSAVRGCDFNNKGCGK